MSLQAMVMAQEKKRLRTRAPVSCLNCKRRKVRCDKGRPCAGCVKNNVGHLCVYVDPKWADPGKNGADPELSDIPTKGIDSATVIAELRQELEARKSEVLCLRAQLAQKQAPAMNQDPGSSTDQGSHITQMHQDLQKYQKPQGFCNTDTSMLKADACRFSRTASPDGPKTSTLIELMREYSTRKIPITVLAKLHGSGSKDQKRVVLHDSSYTMSGFREFIGDSSGDVRRDSGLAITTLYSWLNIIKIDPQLTALWFRITNLQKTYHIYKTTLLKSQSYSESGMPLPMARSRSTGSSDNGQCGHQKCPVVACEFNLMLEESESPEPEGSTKSGNRLADANPKKQHRNGDFVKTEYDASRPIQGDPVKNNLAELDTSENDLFKAGFTRSDIIEGSSIKSEDQPYRPESPMGKPILKAGSADALSMLQTLQKTWDRILGSAASTERLNYAQLSFLVRCYMNPPIEWHMDVGSGSLLRFFKSEISDLFSEKGSEPCLNVGDFSANISDAEVISSLKAKAVYLSMLALIIDETLEVLRLDKSATDSVARDFKDLFPSEMFATGPSGPKILRHVLELTVNLFESSQTSQADVWDCSLAAIALLISLSNRLMLLNDQKDLTFDAREAFTRVFSILMNMLEGEDSPLQIWSDPARVSFGDRESGEGSKYLIGIFLCRIWAETLRLVNNVVFHLLPFLKHGAPIDFVIDRFLSRVPELEASHIHVTFLSGCSQEDPCLEISWLVEMIEVQYVISRTSWFLRSGINRHFSPRGALVSDLSSVILEMAGRRESTDLEKMGKLRRFEVLTILHYLEFYLATVLFLQLEEDGNTESVARLIPQLFEKFRDIHRHLQTSTSHFAKHHHSKYVWAVVAEDLARVSHIISGLLIRFKSGSKSLQGPSSEKNRNVELLIYTPKTSPQKLPNVTLSVAKKEQIIADADRTVELLEKLMGREASRHRTKIWRFYQTFTRNSHRMNPASYAKLHADALGAGRLLDKCPIMSSSGYETSATRMELSRCPVFQPTEKTSNARAHSMSACPVTGGSQRSVGSSATSASRTGPSIKDKNSSRSRSEIRPGSGTGSGIGSEIGSEIGSGIGSELGSGSDLPLSSKSSFSQAQKAPGKCPFDHKALASASKANIGRASPLENSDSRKRKWPYGQDMDFLNGLRRENSGSFMGGLAKYTPPLCAPPATPVLPQNLPQNLPPNFPQNVSPAVRSFSPSIAPPLVAPSASFTQSDNASEPFSQASFADMDWDSLPDFNFDMMDDEALMGQLNSGDFNNPMIEGLFQ